MRCSSGLSLQQCLDVVRPTAANAPTLKISARAHHARSWGITGSAMIYRSFSLDDPLRSSRLSVCRPAPSKLLRFAACALVREHSDLKAGIWVGLFVSFFGRICSACPFLQRVFFEHAPKGLRFAPHMKLVFTLRPEAAGLSKTHTKLQSVKSLHLFRNR